MGWTFAVIDTVSISAIKIHCNMVVDVCGKIYVNFAAKKVCNGCGVSHDNKITVRLVGI